MIILLLSASSPKSEQSYLLFNPLDWKHTTTGQQSFVRTNRASDKGAKPCTTAWPWTHDGHKPKTLRNKLIFTTCTDPLHQPVDYWSRIIMRDLINKTGRDSTVNGRFTCASIVIYVAIVNMRVNIAAVDGRRWHNVKVAFQFIADKMFNFDLGAFVCDYKPRYRLDLLKMVFVLAVVSLVVSTVST